MVVAANSTGMIILGGGVAKHHVCNANSWVRILPVSLVHFAWTTHSNRSVSKYVYFHPVLL